MITRQSHIPASHRNGGGTTARRRGMTLVELTLSMMVTALIGVAVASMLAAVSYGADSSKDIRTLVAKNKAVNTRISAAIRGSTLVLDQGESYLILWTNDTDEDGAPGLHEIRRIQFDAEHNELASYQASDDAPEVVYGLDDDIEAITADLMGTGDFPKQLWATHVASWAIALNTDDPHAASLVSYQLALTSGDLNDTAIAAVSLRNH